MINVDEVVERSYKTLYFWKHADYKDLLHWKSLEMYYKHQYFNSYLLKLKLNFNYFRKESVLQNLFLISPTVFYSRFSCVVLCL